MPDIEAAVAYAADADGDDISTLRLVVGKLGARLNRAARARVLRTVADSHRMDSSYRILPAGPAIRYLIEEAGFDVNLPVSADGDTLLDFTDRGEGRSDEPLRAFLKAHGAESGRRR